MDPVKEPKCAVCGATTDLVGRPEAGWVCAVSGPCIARSSDRAWTIPRDIPEENQVVMVTPYHREVLGEEAAAIARELMKSCRTIDPDFGKATDLLHPTGRCTCGGEGRCAWCSRPCPACGVPTIEHGDTCISMQRACSRCGGLENVLLLVHGWVCDFCLGGDTMPDYEALGYPETGYGRGDLDYAAYFVGFASRGIAASVIQSELEKDILALRISLTVAPRIATSNSSNGGATKRSEPNKL